MNKKFTRNKVVVITGGAKKIGRSTALKLAEQGFNILIHTGGKSINDAKETIKLIKKFEVKAGHVQGDLANIKTIKKIKIAAEQLGVPSILINNAGLRIHDNFER